MNADARVLLALERPALLDVALEAGGYVVEAPVCVQTRMLDSVSRIGIGSMFTLPEFRRRGLGRALLAAVCERASHEGAAGLYLQVEAENDGARAPYENAGFRSQYRYHYRVCTTAPMGSRA